MAVAEYHRHLVIIAVLAVTFLGQVMSWNGNAQLLVLGLSVALVVAALNFYLWIAKASKK